jgi:NADH:ubiquinone oxidoreductase subunit C
MKRDIVTQDQAQEEVDALIADAKLYRAIVEPAFGKWTKEERKIRNYLDALADFRVRQPFPLVLSIMRAYREKGITKKNAEAMLWAIVKFHFTFTAISSKSSSGGLSMMYAAWARALYAAKTEPQRQGAIRQVVNGLAARRPPESDFVAGFKALRYSDDFTKQKKLVRYVLKNIADHVASAGIAADHEQMTIEHIASQNPSSPTAVSDAHVAMMGNLLWCDQHVQHLLKNKSFAEKKEVLKKKSVPGAPDVFRRARWGEREIEARTEDLAKIAYNEIWK